MSVNTNLISLNSKSLLNKFFHGIILNILLKVKGIIYIPLLVNFISKEDVGEISYIRSIVALSTGILFLNIPDSSNRIILSLTNKKFELHKTINTFSNFSFFLGVLLILLFILITSCFNLLDIRIVLIVSTMLFVSLLDKISKYIFQIFQNTGVLSVTTLLTEYVSLLIVYIILYYKFYNDAISILYVYSFCLFISAIYLLYKLYSTFSYQFVIDFLKVKEVLQISLFLFPASYGLLIIQSSDFLIIEYFLGLGSLAEYSLSYSLASIVNGVSMAITFFWYSSVVYANKEQILSLINKILKISLIALILIILGFELFGKDVINIISPQYQSTHNVIMILIVGFFMSILNTIYQGIMYADKKEKVILLDTLTCALLNIVFNLIFIPVYGIIFAAFSTSLSFILLFIFRTIHLMKYFSNSNRESIILYSFLIVIISLLTIAYYIWI